MIWGYINTFETFRYFAWYLMRLMLPIGDGICKRVRDNRFEIFIENFNGIHVVLGVENAVHMAGDCVTQNFELFHGYGLMTVVEENLKCHRCLRHDGVARLMDCC